MMQTGNNSVRVRALLGPRQRFVMVSLLLAFLFPYARWEQAAGGAILLLVFSLAILPRLGASVDEPHSELLLSQEGGKVLWYPIAVLALILLYRNYLYVAAGAWAVMALGGGITAVARAHGRSGGRWGLGRLPWNREKTWLEFLAFAVAGTLASYVLVRWVAPQIPAQKTAIACAVAALVGAVVEGLPISLASDLTVPMAAGAILFCAFLVERSALASNQPYLGRRLWMAAAVNLAFALMARGLRAASLSGAVCGFFLGSAIYLGYGYKSFLLLFTFVLLGSLTTRLGFARKTERGVAEDRGGARGWREATANLLSPACFAILVITTHHEAAFLLALAAALAEAAGDTVSSEIGQWTAERAYLITNWKAVAAGEDGGISLAGTAAGFAASAIVALLALGLGLCGPYHFAGAALVLGAAWAGNLLDSLMGATIQRRGLIGNSGVNLAGTTLAGALALALAIQWGL